MFWKKNKKQIKFSSDPGVNHLEWRKDPELLEAANRLISNADFKAVFSTLIASRPSKTNLPIGLTSEQLAAQAMFCSGYEYCLDMMISLAKELDSEADASPTFQED